jgi:uncharacterized RDD family membrane protein YckC
MEDPSEGSQDQGQGPSSQRPPPTAADAAVGLVAVTVLAGKIVAQAAVLPLRLLGDRRGRSAGEGLASFGRAAEERGREEAAAAIDRTLAGPLTDSFARSLATHHVAERVAREVLASPDFQEAVRAALASPDLERIAVEAAGSGLTAEVTERVLASPEVRAAIARQGADVAEGMLDQIRARLVALDDRIARRPAPSYGGVATRGAALLVDLALAHLIVLFGGLLTWLLFSLVGGLRPAWLADTLASAAWAVVVGGYFIGFWALVGQTPGGALMQLRVAARDGTTPGVGRSLVRFVGLLVSIVIFVGWVPIVLDDRRRALQDFLAGTTVLRSP